ncbi:haloacid dehalogenase [Jannaschia pagri]|uniref:Haloacid dehalogenase n=1 Tax=Jannaschia pagri TaxID=2829797 RepID=A0ABQ4NKW2_9RHOB|nr:MULTISPECIES: HAD family hydrolase [unclassified Jannaschia]GIT90906.1 haloacid dehalogenase [Jannaschia sp. AI_61]GIT94737.1 haloacid dehalogenase [Jannaschia sp. AI_62]
MPDGVTTIAFDADDTLWHTETYFRLTQDRFADLLRDHADPDHLMERLLAAERRNLGHYGFGVKGFVLSMVETAIEVTEGRVPASTISRLLDEGREMLRHPIDLLPGAEDTVRSLAQTHRLVLITKGDLLDQERKLAESGLGDLFDGIEIVSDKVSQTYTRAFDVHGDGAARGLMVGNSLKSDVIPALEAGAWGVFCPSEIEWALEAAPAPLSASRYRRIETLADLPSLLTSL